MCTQWILRYKPPWLGTCGLFWIPNRTLLSRSAIMLVTNDVKIVPFFWKFPQLSTNVIKSTTLLSWGTRISHHLNIQCHIVAAKEHRIRAWSTSSFSIKHCLYSGDSTGTPRFNREHAVGMHPKFTLHTKKSTMIGTSCVYLITTPSAICCRLSIMLLNESTW